MSSAEGTHLRDSVVEAIRAKFAGVYVPIALRGLRAMLVDDGSRFCFRACAAAGVGLRLEGASERYSAMSLIGLARQEALSRDVGFDYAKVVERLAGWAPDAPDLGDAGLVLWLHVLRGDDRAAALARRIVARGSEALDTDHGYASMERGFLLIGLSEALRAGLDVAGLRALAEGTVERLRANQNPDTGLFSFGAKVFRKNLHRARVDARLGSFASQVYPTMGFAAFARATGDAATRQVATRTAQRLCELQGAEGQWWWVYQTRRPTAAVRYPVYTVHQDAMGPMALLAAALCDGATDRYDAAVHKSLTWFDDRPECRGEALVDDERGVVWRAVQHDHPEHTGRLGLGAGELRRMGRSAWLGFGDARGLSAGFVCPECRPYHLGWILLADAMFEECLAARG